MIPRMLSKTKKARLPGEPERVRCPAHLSWVRKHGCCVPGCESRQIEAAHTRTGTDGALGVKPGDNWAISLCVEHHREQHTMGERSFETKYGINMKNLATEFVRKSPHRRKVSAS